MAQDIYSMTPGSAVADTLQQILQRRREQSRQAMIDKLQEEQTRASMSAQTRGLDLQERGVGLEERRTRDSELTNEMARRASQESLIKSQLESVQEGTSKDQMPAELYEAAKQRGYMSPMAPQVSSSYDVGAGPVQEPGTPSGPPSEVFMTPARRAQMTQQKDVESWIAANPDAVKDNPELVNILTMRGQTGMDVPFPAEVLGPAPSLTTVSHTGRVGESRPLPRGAHVTQLPQPYQMPSWSAPTPYQVFDKTDKLIGTTPPMSREDMATYMQANPDHVLRPFGFQPNNSTSADRLMQAATRLQIAASDTTNRRADELEVARNAVLASRDITPNAQKALTYIVQNLRNGTRPPTPADVPRAVAAVQQPFGLSEQDAINVQEILSVYLSVPLE